MTTAKEHEDEEDDKAIVAYALMREVKGAKGAIMLYDWFSESMEECQKRMEACDYDANECSIYGLEERALDKYLARSLPMREYAKLLTTDKIKAANNLLMTMVMWPFDHEQWELVNTAEFFGYKQRGATLDTNWLDRAQR